MVSFFLTIFAQERKVYHVSTDVNPIAQMHPAIKEEFKKFLTRELEQDLSPSPVLDNNTQAQVLAAQQKEAEKNRARL